MSTFKEHTTEEKIKLIHAEDEGRIVEVLSEGAWHPKPTYFWNFKDNIFRIKPRIEKVTVKRWIVVHSDGLERTFVSRADALCYNYSGSKVVELSGSYEREVL